MFCQSITGLLCWIWCLDRNYSLCSLSNVTFNESTWLTFVKFHFISVKFPQIIQNLSRNVLKAIDLTVGVWYGRNFYLTTTHFLTKNMYNICLQVHDRNPDKIFRPVYKEVRVTLVLGLAYKLRQKLTRIYRYRFFHFSGRVSTRG